MLRAKSPLASTEGHQDARLAEGAPHSEGRGKSGRPQRVTAAHLNELTKRLSRALWEELHIPLQANLVRIVSAGLPQFAFNRTRTMVLRAMGLRIGSRSMVMGSIKVTGGGGVALVSIGEHSFITGPLHLDAGAQIQVGSRVHFGHDVLLLTMNHEIGASEERWWSAYRRADLRG